MKKATILMTVLFFGLFLWPRPGSAQTEEHGLYRYVDLTLGGWVASGDASFTISGSDLSGGFKSKLTWKNLSGIYPLVGIEVTPMPWRHSLYLNLKTAAGSLDGDGTDEDWLTGDFATFFGTNYIKSRSDTESDGSYTALDLGYTYRYGRRFGVVGFGGYFQFQEKFTMTKGFQEAPLWVFGPFFGLNSTYDMEWDGWRVGGKGYVNFVPSPRRGLYDLGLKVEGALLWGVDYTGEGVWNLREDFRQDPSFRHTADGGTGGQFSLSLFYHPVRYVGIEVGYYYLTLNIEDGIDRTFFSDGSEGLADLDEVTADRHGFTASASVRF